MKLIIVNLEHSMPTVEQARIRLDQGLREAKSQKKNLLKLIHGYGSTGKGGAIKKDVPIYLREQKLKNRLVDFVGGEDFSPFNPITRELLAQFPQLAKDSDFSKNNAGITIVLVTKNEN